MEANAEGERLAGGKAACSSEYFLNLESLKHDFKHFWGDILQNSEEYKVHHLGKLVELFPLPNFSTDLHLLRNGFCGDWGGGGHPPLATPLRMAQYSIANGAICFLIVITGTLYTCKQHYHLKVTHANILLNMCTAF